MSEGHVSRARIHIVSPWLLERPAGDPELRFVAFMCACCAEVLNGRLAGAFTSEFAEEWARLALIAADDLEALDAVTDAEAAAELNVRADQIHAARSAVR